MSDFARSAEKTFRHFVVYPTLRSVLRNEQVPLPIDLNNVRRILLLRYDRLGDVIVTSPMVRRLRSLAPHASIGMMTSRNNLPAARLLSGIERYHTIGGSIVETAAAVRDARLADYDLVLNLVFNRTTSGGLLANMIAPRGIKVGQGAEKYRFYFNALAQLERGQHHMSEVLRSLGSQVFGERFVDDDLRYELTDDPASSTRVDEYVSRVASSAAILNMSAGDPARTPSEEQLLAMIRHVRLKYGLSVIVIAAPGKERARDVIVRACGDARVTSYPKEGGAPFPDMVALVRRGKVLITPDTSLVHVAGATATPVLALYTTAFTLAEWGPRHTESEVVLGEEGLPLSAMPVAKMLDGFDRLYKRVTR